MAGSFVQICDVAFRKWNLNFHYTFVSQVSGCAGMNRIYRMNSRKLNLCSVEIPKYFAQSSSSAHNTHDIQLPAYVRLIVKWVLC